MDLQELHPSRIIVDVTVEAPGQTFRRELPVDYYENANFLRLQGERMDGSPSELVFITDTGRRRLDDLTGHGPDQDPCGSHTV